MGKASTAFPLPLAESVDLGVCDRQATGGGFSPTSKDPEYVTQLESGTLQFAGRSWQHPSPLPWDADPFRSPPWRAQLHTLRWLDPLRRAHLDGHPHAGALWWQHASEWLRSPAASASSDAWGLALGVRAKTLVLGFPLVPVPERDHFLQALHLHGERLAALPHTGRPARVIPDLHGLLCVAGLLRSGKWMESVRMALHALMASAMDDNGLTAFVSWAQQLRDYQQWRAIVEALSAERVETSELFSKLALLEQSLTQATLPDTLLDVRGDEQPTRLRLTRSPELLYISSLGAEGHPPAQTAFHSAQAGYISGRSGWGEFETDFDQETFFSLSYDGSGPGAGHDDAGQLTYYTRGHHWLVDPGPQPRDGKPSPSHFARRVAHNVLTLDGTPRDPEGQISLNRWTSTEAYDDLELVDNGYAGVKVRRRVVFHRASEALVIIDYVHSPTIAVEGHQRWQLPSDVSVESVPTGLRLRSTDSSIRMLWLGKRPELDVLTGRPTAGWVSTRYGARPSPQVRARQSGRLFRFITVIGPERRGIFEVRRTATLPQGVALSLQVGTQEFQFSLTADSVLPVFHSPTQSSGTSTATKGREILRSWSTSTPPSPEPLDELIHQARQAVAHDPSADTRAEWAGRLVHRIDFIDDSHLREPKDAFITGALIDVVGTQPPAAVNELLHMWHPLRPALLPTKGHPVAAGYKHVMLYEENEALSRLAEDSDQIVGGVSLNGPMITPWVARGGEGPVLMVRAHGALNRTRTRFPILLGMSGAERTPFPFVIIPDGGLDLHANLTLGWYLGRGEYDGQQITADIVRKVQSALSTPSAVISGSSGGGFTSLQVAALLPHASALAFNPQTDLQHYSPFLVSRALQASFNQSDLGLIGSSDVRTSVLKRWTALQSYPTAHIVSNTGDLLHNQRHVLPLFEATRGEGNVTVEHIEQGPGHVAPPRQAIAEWTRQAILRAQESL